VHRKRLVWGLKKYAKPIEKNLLFFLFLADIPLGPNDAANGWLSWGPGVGARAGFILPIFRLISVCFRTWANMFAHVFTKEKHNFISIFLFIPKRKPKDLVYAYLICSMYLLAHTYEFHPYISPFLFFHLVQHFHLLKYIILGVNDIVDRHSHSRLKYFHYLLNAYS